SRDRSWLFFFQAEDGIRDGHVTGVQTCALPISGPPNVSWFSDLVGSSYFAPKPLDRKNDYGGTLGGPVWIPKVYNGHDRTFFFRSEERRVGKECRAQW